MKIAALALGLASAVYGQSLQEVLGGAPELSNLTEIATPLLPQLAGLMNITILAPNNDAFAEFMSSGSPMVEMFSAMEDLRAAVLQYHIIQGNYSTIPENLTFLPTELRPGMYANVTGGQRVSGIASGDSVTFFSALMANSTVVNASIPFDQGTIHIIDSILSVPMNVTETARLANLTAAVGAIQQLDLGGPLTSTPDVTLFVPNNEAFQRISGNLAELTPEQLTGILSYHAHAGGVYYSTNITNGSSLSTLAGEGMNLTLTIQDDEVYVNNARVVTPNVLVANGVVHVIDRVLNPMNATAMPNPTMTEEAFPSASSGTDIPFTSGVEAPTSAVETGAQASATESAGGASRPMETGALGMAALFGGAAFMMNL